MKPADPNSFSDRLKTAAEAKKALLDKFRPKPNVTDPLHAERAAIREAELRQVRAQRAQAKADAKQAAASVQAALQADEALALEAKRGERRERKALTKVEQKAKRDARYAARKARQ